MADTDKLMQVFKDLINFGRTLDEKAADGKLTWMEIFTSAVSVVPSVFNWIKNGKEIYEELIDLDDLEREELVQAIADELELSNKRTEAQIEAGAELVAALDKFRGTFKKEE